MGGVGWALDWTMYMSLTASSLLCQLCLETIGIQLKQRGFALDLLSGICLPLFPDRFPPDESKQHYLPSSLLPLRPSDCYSCWLRLAACNVLLSGGRIILIILTLWRVLLQRTAEDVNEFEARQSVLILIGPCHWFVCCLTLSVTQGTTF